jgi:hypothetical protein
MFGNNDEELSKIQDELDDFTSTYVEEDFKLKLQHDRKIKHLLAKRDKIVEQFSKEEKNVFFGRICSNFDALAEFFPVKADGECDVSFIKSFKAEYLEPFKMRVFIELYENEYIENLSLEKVISLFEENPDTTKITMKNEKGSCLLFDYFESNEDDFEAFDILYEFYVDQLFFVNLDDE